VHWSWGQWSRMDGLCWMKRIWE